MSVFELYVYAACVCRVSRVKSKAINLLDPGVTDNCGSSARAVCTFH